MFNPTDPRNIPHFANLCRKPIVILGNGPQIDRLQARFWDRLNKIQQQADSELVVVGVNRIGISVACRKHAYKPDALAIIDKPQTRLKTNKDRNAESAAKAAEREQEARQMRAIKHTMPKQYEIWEATQAALAESEARAQLGSGGKVERVPTDITNAFMRSMSNVAGVSKRIASVQARGYLVPEVLPTDVVLNMDENLKGPANRAHMIFTTADWLVNWFGRLGAREFYFYGVSMSDGGHCKCEGLPDDKDDDYSWEVESRHKVAFHAFRKQREVFPGLKLYNCDRKSLFVLKDEMEFGTPPQLSESYTLKSDAECIQERDAVMQQACEMAAPMIKKAKENAAIAALKKEMAADAKKAACESTNT